MRASRAWSVGATVCVVALSACSTKAAQENESSTDGIKTDVGISDTEIQIGALTDLSGPFKTNGLAYTAGNKIWVEDVNSRGGICGRDIKLDVQDTGYKPDNAVALYETMRTESAALLQLVGSPMVAALKAKLSSDNMLTLLGVGSSINLDAEALMMVTQTYDVEIINGLGYLRDQGLIAEGDKIGAVYIDNEGGQNMLMGTQYFAEQNGMTVVDIAVSATDTDLTATVTKLKESGVAAVAVTTSANAAASLALQTQAQGMDVPLVATTPVFASTMLGDPQTVSALQQFYLSTSFQLYGEGGAEMQKLVEMYESGYDEAPDRSIPVGYVSGLALEAVLEKACENGDLTRQGILEARKQVTALDTDGLTGELDFSDPGAPSTRESLILGIDSSAPLGLVVKHELFSAPEAADYQTPYQS